MKEINCFTLLLLLFCFVSCKEQSEKNNVTQQKNGFNKEMVTTITHLKTTTKLDKNIRSIFQSKNSDYWFGTNGTGLYRYDGKTLTHYTTKDGLTDNQIQSIQEDAFGNMWFGTGNFGVSCFDGQAFKTFTNKENLELNNTLRNKWQIETNNLWFYAGAGVYKYNGKSFVYLPFDYKNNFKSSPYNLSRYAVYSILQDTKGNVWFGTQAEGVCCYDGKNFTWFAEKGLSGPAVLGMFEDSKGNIWMGNNGSGLFRYDGKSLINLTEEKGLSNNEFRVSGKSKQGTLARVYSINEDNYGNLWVGTVDTGVWKYDGINLTNYTTKDGLTSNAINTIYKDKNNDLWFGTDENGICKFNGKSFVEFVIK